MTATFTAEKRRLSPTPPRPLRELPVLFHLMDVSRPKGYAVATPSFSLGGVSESTRPGGEHQPASSLDSAESFDLETAAKLVETKAFGSLPAEPVAAPAPESVREASSEFASEYSGEQFPAETLLAPTETPPTDNTDTAEAKEPALETPPPATDDAVTLRQRAAERTRKRQADQKDDWFRTQGRFIVIGFVAALGITIYVARTNRRPAAPPVAIKRQAQASGPTDGVKKTQTKLPLASGPSVSITNVRPTNKANTVKATSSEPQTALHPPTIPQLAQQPATGSAPATDTLFSFSKPAEDRLASRSEGPHSSAPSATPPSAAPGTPTLQPQYPATSYPGSYQPVAPPAVYSAPNTAPSTAPPGPGLNPAASAAPLYPTTNTARGIRNERNGSGLY